jgi:Tfp pilus assembly protein PilX
MKRLANQGMAIISALGFLAVITVLIGAAMMIGLSTSRLSKDNTRATRAQYAAESGVERAIYEAYTKVLAPAYLGKSATWRPTLADYKAALSTASFNGKSLTSGDSVGIEFTSTLADGGSYNVKVTRIDTSELTTDKVTLKVVSEGTFGSGKGEGKRKISQEVVISSLRFNGDPYAILSNNVNCIFCHTTVTSIEAAYANNNSTLKLNSANGLANHAGTESIRVATLESLNVDRSVDSVIAGTLYTRGSTNLPQMGGASFITREDDNDPNTRDKNLNNSLTALTNSSTDPISADCSVSSQCVGGKSFYKKYLAQGGPDGEIPEKFPLPIPDGNSNRKIDDNEWTNAISNDPNKGYIIGGSKKFMQTSAYGTRGSSLSSVGGNKLSSLDNARGIAGNLVIDGNFEIQGTVYVDGDVVISGKMKGNGKIVARGNVYVVGDIKYDCGSSACDYSDPSTLPTFAMVAGGNMLIGQYMTTATGDQSWTNTYEQCGTGSKVVQETTTETQSWYQLQKRTRTRTKSRSGSFGGWSGWSAWSNDGSASETSMSVPGTFKSPTDSATPRPGTQTETSYKRINVDVEVPITVDVTKTFANRCSYQRWTTSDAETKYGKEYFDGVLTNTSSESPEYIDPGKYLPFIDPAKTTLTAEEQAILQEYFGSVPAANSDERQSYGRATWVKGDDKGINGSCDTDLETCGNYRTRGSFTANEMAAFNQREYCKSQSSSSERQGCSDIGVDYISGYKPRFYQMRPGAGIYRCANYDASECRSYGDSTKGNDYNQKEYYVGANYTEITSSDLTALGATTFGLSPTDNWLATGADGRDSERVLKEIWKNKIEDKNSNEPLQIDGTVYSSNAVFSIIPARSRANGSMTINGSLIAADLGVLSVGSDEQRWNNFQTDPNSNEQSGLRVHYDKRLNGLIGLKGNGQEGIVLIRSSFKQERRY